VDRSTLSISDDAVDVRAVSKVVGQHPVLLDVTFAVPPGEVAFIQGPRGSGKSALVKLLAGHLAPSGGRIRIAGVDARTSRVELSRHVGYVSQHSVAWGRMRVRDVLQFSGRSRHITASALDERVAERAQRCGIEKHLDQPCCELGRCARTAVAIALALLHDPAVLLIDAPFQDLDRSDAERLAEVIDEGRGHSTVVCTGIDDLPETLVRHRLLRLASGRLVEHAVRGSVPA
jgi:ABC-2 type transport system ATP-binding protein